MLNQEVARVIKGNLFSKTECRMLSISSESHLGFHLGAILTFLKNSIKPEKVKFFEDQKEMLSKLENFESFLNELSQL